MLSKLTALVKRRTWDDLDTIVHACGALHRGTKYLNSYEALQNTLRAGAQAVEIDFCFTADGVLVCEHGWKDYGRKPLTLQDFMAAPARDNTTHMTAETALSMLAKKGSPFLVMDSQNKDFAAVYATVVDLLKDLGHKSYLKRVVPQIFFEKDYEAIQAVYPWENWIFSSVKQHPKGFEDFERISDYCLTHDIGTVAMPRRLAVPENIDAVRSRGLNVAVHVVNKAKERVSLRKLGVKLVFTDYLHDPKIR